jgi:hypothetical protein
VSYELSVKEKEGYLHFQVTGDNEKETVKNYLAAIYEECLRRHISAILLEENLQGPGLKVLDIFRIAEEGSLTVGSAIRRVAYVDSNSEHSKPNMRFATTVASNRGLNVRLFSSVKDADEWLRLPVQDENQSVIETN